MMFLDRLNDTIRKYVMYVSITVSVGSGAYYGAEGYVEALKSEAIENQVSAEQKSQIESIEELTRKRGRASEPEDRLLISEDISSKIFQIENNNSASDELNKFAKEVKEWLKASEKAEKDGSVVEAHGKLVKLRRSAIDLNEKLSSIKNKHKGGYMFEVDFMENVRVVIGWFMFITLATFLYKLVRLIIDGSLLKKLRILIVEDNRINAHFTLAMVEKLGGEAVIVDSGQKAINLLKKDRKFSFVLMDYNMPVMDGFEAVGYIREMEKANAFDRMTIIALTANVVYGIQEACIEAGMDDYISKPMKKRELMSAIRKWI